MKALTIISMGQVNTTGQMLNYFVKLKGAVSRNSFAGKSLFGLQGMLLRLNQYQVFVFTRSRQQNYHDSAPLIPSKNSQKET